MAKTFNEILDRLQALLKGKTVFGRGCAWAANAVSGDDRNIDLLARFQGNQERRTEAIAHFNEQANMFQDL
jgi:hypothetical protein